jgi:hypothetical protein
VQNDPQQFSGADLVWDGHRWQKVPFQGGIDAYDVIMDLYDFSTPSGLTYQATAAPAGQDEPAYRLVPTGIDGPEVTFRNTRVLHLAKLADADTLYSFDPVGQFRGNTLAAQSSNPLNWLPESTYTPPPVVLRYDAQGRPVSPAPLIPTTNPAGYILQPPLALTTLSTAVRLRGDHVISAIRVRAAGVDRADPHSWQQIQQLAATIEQRTHLRVLVTLGSSPKPVLVYVPGVKPGQFGATRPIDPIGWVEERWIVLGAGIVYLQQLGATRLLLLGAVLLVCLGYLVVAFSALVAAQRRDFAILSALGWPPWQPARLFLVQALLLGLGGGLAGVGVALLAIALLGAIPVWPIVVWALPAMLVLALISALYSLWQLWRIQPAEILRAGAALSSKKVSRPGFPRWWVMFSITALVVRNLARARPRTLLAIGSLFLSAVLLVLVVSGLLTLRQTLEGTLLGNFVLLQTAGPQIAGGVFAVLLTFLSVADLLLLQVRERQQEIGLLQAVGWRPVLVQRLFVQEGIILALVGSIPGALVALGILRAQHQGQGVAPVLVGVGTVGVMLLVAALAALPAMRVLKRLPVSDILREE